MDTDEDPGAGRDVAFLAVVGLLVGLLAIRSPPRAISDPIASVRRALARVEEGDLDARVPVDDGSEVGLLQAGFNRWPPACGSASALRDLFGRHVGRTWRARRSSATATSRSAARCARWPSCSSTLSARPRCAAERPPTRWSRC